MRVCHSTHAHFSLLLLSFLLSNAQETPKSDSDSGHDTGDFQLQVARTDSTETVLPRGWDKYAREKDGKRYYANRKSGKSSWTPPPGSIGGSATKLLQQVGKQNVSCASSDDLLVLSCVNVFRWIRHALAVYRVSQQSMRCFIQFVDAPTQR